MAEMKAKEAQQAIEGEELAAGQLAAEAQRLEELLANQELKWFTETYIRPLVDAERTTALDPKSTKDQGDYAKQRHAIADEIYMLLPVMAINARALARNAYENLPKKNA